MKIIGITGGVGAGKSELLHYMQSHFKCRILFADQVAHRLKEPGQICYEQLILLLGNEILNLDGTIDNRNMAERIFADKALLKKVNAIIHPAVTEYILQEIENEKRKGSVDFFLIEAALLIENHYHKIVDELWYIYASDAVRKERLKDTRNYSDEKINQIMSEQLTEEEFRKNCHVTIDNSGSLQDAEKQIDEKLGEYLWQEKRNIRDN